jgi:hypothetical protein
LIVSDQERATRDNKAAKHDIALLKKDIAARVASTGKAHWNGSAAQRLLKLDVDAGRHNLLKPKELYNDPDRIEYRHFTLNEFRKHIYQEASSRRQKSYWLSRKKKDKKTAKDAPQNTDL